jgi:drug/metabolite transporter (DMT)-like permease
VVAILGGLGAAFAWAASGLFSSRSSRVIDPSIVVAWMAIVGLILIGPFVVASGVPTRLDASAAGWLALAGAGNITGLLAIYVAYREGAAVVLIAPLVATEGAIAAVIAFVGGEHVSVGVGVSLLVIAVGVSLTAVPPAGAREDPPMPGIDPLPVPRPVSPAGAAAAAAAAAPATATRGGEHSGRVLALAALAAISFGFSLYATGHVSSKLPLSWVILPARAVGVALVALPLLAAGRLHPRLLAPAWPLVLGAGACEVIGFASYTLGARHDVAVAAVVACQFAAISAIVAFLLWGERLGRLQLGGVIVLLVGISVLSGLRG